MIDKRQIQFAQKYLASLKDGSGTLIFDHAVRVHLHLSTYLSKYEISNKDVHDIRLAGLFHDLLEDTKASEVDILNLSSQRTLDMVREMTIDFKGKTIPQTVKPLYEMSDYTTLVKLADIYDNVRKSNFLIRVNGIEWYLSFFVPLLKEYKKLIVYKVEKAVLFKRPIQDLSEEVLEEIETFFRTVKTFTSIV